MSFDIEITARRGGFQLEVSLSTGARTLCLFGRSGAGKTSVAEAVAGLLRPERGRIVIDGEPLFDSARGLNLPPWRRRIGYVFQSPRLFPHLDVRGNLTFGALGGAIGPARLDEVVARLGLEPLLGRRPAGLSGGEGRRVAIGRALLSDPRLLILDEPYAGLDAARREELAPYLDALAADAALPILHVTHSPEAAVRFAEAMALMAEGAVVACGPPETVFEHPEAESAAALAAPLSVLDGVVEVGPADGEAGSRPPTRLRVGETVVLGPALALPVGARARLVVDARDVALARGPLGALSLQNRLQAQVSAVEPWRGARLVRLAGAGFRLKALVTREAEQALMIAPGETLTALFKATSAARRD